MRGCTGHRGGGARSQVYMQWVRGYVRLGYTPVTYIIEPHIE